MGLLEQKVVIVTGGAQGIGLCAVERFAAEGAIVAIWDFNTDKGAAAESQLRAKGLDVRFRQVDVTAMDSVKAAVQALLQATGRIDVLVNNAGLYGGLKGARFEHLDEAQWDAVMNINVKGLWQCCKAVVEPMRAAGGGSIINISSLAAVYGLPYGLDYVASKAAVIGMTRGMARELGRDRIRVNAVAPSAVMTEGTEEFFGAKLEKAKQVIAAGQLIQRNLEVEDLTGTIIYLASDSSAFVTGQTHMVDGGSWFL